jgi:GNAT superfamily N-acetyltransferase
VTSPLRIELARPGQGARIARWIARALDPAVLPLTIWRSPRAGCYVEFLLSSGHGPDPYLFYMLYAGPHLAGLAAFRTLDGDPFLNHLCIGRRWRGRGWGRRLLTGAAVRYLRLCPARRLRLDVFAGTSAEAWYRRLGFTPQTRLRWQTHAVSPNGAPAADALPVKDLDLAERQHRDWGFSCFHAGPYSIGRLFAPYFRLTDPHAARDRDLIRLLASLEPSRRLLLVAPAAMRRWRTRLVSHRMTCAVDVFFNRLGVSHA